MTTLTIFLAGFSLATFAWGIFYALILLHRPRYTAPTRRRNRDRLPEVHNYPPMPVCKPAKNPCIGCYGGDLPCVCGNRQTARDADFAEAGGIDPLYMYGVTGEER
jgi:hypothetical protein